MSRAIVHEPVVSQVTTDKISNPAPIVATTVVHDPISHQYSGDQTSIPDMPPS